MDKDIRRWSRWTSAQHRQAEDALVTSGLVRRTPRKGAGRRAFLPGEWLRTPGFESRKMPLHELAVRPGSKPGVIDMQGAYAVRKPLPELFRTARQRVLAGGGPA